MAFQVTYARDTYKPDDNIIPGNSAASNPVEFDLCPAEGPDLARIKSVLVATSGLVQDRDWGPDMQAAVIAAYETGAPAFVNTIEAIRGLTIPAAMAKRVGIIQDIPTHVVGGSSTPVPNNDAPIPIVTGFQYSRICGFVNLSLVTMQLASEIAKLSNKTNVDPRLFAQPSGSGGRETARTRPTAAQRAKSRPGRRETAADPTTPPASPPAGTSDGKPS